MWTKHALISQPNAFYNAIPCITCRPGRSHRPSLSGRALWPRFTRRTCRTNRPRNTLCPRWSPFTSWPCRTYLTFRSGGTILSCGACRACITFGTSCTSRSPWACGPHCTRCARFPPVPLRSGDCCPGCCLFCLRFCCLHFCHYRFHSLWGCRFCFIIAVGIAAQLYNTFL